MANTWPEEDRQISEGRERKRNLGTWIPPEILKKLERQYRTEATKPHGRMETLKDRLTSKN